ncbi:MAG TPA: hypothetical protein VGM79_24010 [Streptosporangiaceae bacterium]
MTPDARTTPGASPPAQAADAHGAPPADPAGRLLRQLTVLPALLAMAWLLAGLPLLLLGAFTPVLMLVLSVPLAASLTVLAVRWMPGRPGLLAGLGQAPARTPWWTVAALVAVAVAFGVDQAVYHSQQIIVQRDPASYIQFGTWIASHGSLPIPKDTAAFGGTHGLLSFYGPAFHPVGQSIVPQFMAGLPMLLAAGFWAGGVGLAVAAGALIGACGVLALGGLIARLVGPRWAPLGALILALALPEQFTSRSTYSEPLAQVLFLGGLCLIIDAFAAGPGGPARSGRRVLAALGGPGLAALGGLAVGLTLLVRIDGASDMLPLIPYCGLLLLQRSRLALPLIGGVAAGAAYGVIDGVVLSRPYLASIKGSLLPLVAIAGLLVVVTGAAVALRWRRGLPELRGNWLPNAAAALAFAVTAGLALRPYLQTVHGQRTASDVRAMTGYQQADHLPVDPTRLYYEISLHWVFWYVGVPAVALATIGAAVLGRRCLQGRAPAWTLPLLSFAWIIVATLLRPGITPDQPWASRRLVPGVLPGVILLALWAASWLTGWLRERGLSPAIRAVAVAVVGAALVLPAAVTTFGISYQDGSGGSRLAAGPLADTVTYSGEISAVRGMCAAIGGNASVVIISPATADRMAQVVRGMCGDPAALLGHPTPQKMRVVARGIRAAGRRPVILAAGGGRMLPYAARPRRILVLHIQADEHALTAPPERTLNLTYTVWMGLPRR